MEYNQTEEVTITFISDFEVIFKIKFNKNGDPDPKDIDFMTERIKAICSADIYEE